MRHSDVEKRRRKLLRAEADRPREKPPHGAQLSYVHMLSRGAKQHLMLLGKQENQILGP